MHVHAPPQVRLPFISAKLNIPAADVEQLLVSLILDKKIQGHIDQVGTWLASVCVCMACMRGRWLCECVSVSV